MCHRYYTFSHTYRKMEFHFEGSLLFSIHRPFPRLPSSNRSAAGTAASVITMPADPAASTIVMSGPMNATA